MLSFHNDEKIKQKYLERVIAHRKADNIIQGIGWEDGRGCAVGCSLENYDHSRYPIELGLPEWIARLEDTIFEGLPKNEAIEWPEKFLSVIPVGVDVEDVKHKIAMRRMDRLIELQKTHLDKYEFNSVIVDVISCLQVVKKCHEAQLNKQYCDWNSAADSAHSAADSAARSTAHSAADSALSAALSAALSTAYSADLAVRSAVRSTALSTVRSTAYSADLAVRSAAYSAPAYSAVAAWKQEASDLLELLAECK